MFNSISARWQTLKTKYKKIIPFVLTFIFCLSPLSVSAAELSPDAKSDWFLFPFDSLNGVAGTFNIDNGVYQGSGAFNSNYVYATDNFTGGVFPSVTSGHRYLLYFTFTAPTEFDYVRTVIRSDTNDSSPSFSLYPESHGSLISFNNTFVQNTTTISGIIDFVSDKTLQFSTGSSFLIQLDKTINISGRLDWAFYLLDITDNTDSEVNQIITAINNQTDFIVNGDSSTGGIVAGADSSKSELESIVSEYQEIENSMLDNFTMYQTDILTDLNGWSWGGLSLCANWVGDTMTSYFQNMGDFKQYIIYPLLLGIALFFIGRGSSIIGHLYRKPTDTYTFKESSSSTKYVNGQRITSSVTKTNRDGGVLRK